MWIHIFRWINVFVWIHTIRWIHITLWIHTIRWIHTTVWIHTIRRIHIIMWIHTIRWIHITKGIHTIRWIHIIMWITYYVNWYNQMNSLHYIRIHTSYEFLLCWCNALFVGALIFIHFWCSEGGRTVLFVSEHVLMRLEVRKEDLFALFLCCWQLHCLMEIDVVKVAE